MWAVMSHPGRLFRRELGHHTLISKKWLTRSGLQGYNHMFSQKDNTISIVFSSGLLPTLRQNVWGDNHKRHWVDKEEKWLSENERGKKDRGQWEREGRDSQRQKKSRKGVGKREERGKRREKGEKRGNLSKQDVMIRERTASPHIKGSWILPQPCKFYHRIGDTSYTFKPACQPLYPFYTLTQIHDFVLFLFYFQERCQSCINSNWL